MSLKKRTLNPQSFLDYNAIKQRATELGVKEAHVGHLMFQVLHRGVPLHELGEKSNCALPARLIAAVQREFALPTSKVVRQDTSADGSTTKLVVELQDGNRVESVIMRYGAHELKNFPDDRDKRPSLRMGERAFRSNPRATVCVSSQVGCAMACTFCATGTMGLLANLTAGEILEQLYHANQIEPIRNVVFMGMGEPLDNYDAVLEAIQGMVDVQRFSLKMERVCVSTVGVVNRLRTLARDAPGVSLALSLHAPTQELRQQIVPTSKAWPLEKIMAAVDTYFADMAYLHSTTKARCMIEYVLIAGVNDSLENAETLGRLLQGKPFHVNVIPYNPTNVKHNYARPSRAHADAFCEKVREFGLMTILRQTMGDDVAGACGQLVLDVKKKEQAAAGGGGGGGGGCESASAAASSASAAAAAPPQPVAASSDIEDIVAAPRRRTAVPAAAPTKKVVVPGQQPGRSPVVLVAIVVALLGAFLVFRYAIEQMKTIYGV
jgi:sorting nexin-8